MSIILSTVDPRAFPVHIYTPYAAHPVFQAAAGYFCTPSSEKECDIGGQTELTRRKIFSVSTRGKPQLLPGFRPQSSYGAAAWRRQAGILKSPSAPIGLSTEKIPTKKKALPSFPFCDNNKSDILLPNYLLSLFYPYI
eukprot:IDg9233t1